MTARAVPPEPQLTTQSERSVWERLVAGLDDDEVVVSNLRLHADRDRELDLVVLSPGRGVAVLEVKGGSVWVDDDGQWQQRTSYGTRRIDPVEQAVGGKHELLRYLRSDPRWGSRGRVRATHGVVLPFTELHDDFCRPDLPQWAVHGRGDQDQLVDRVRAAMCRKEIDGFAPTHEDVDTIVEVLSGRQLPTYDRTALAAERAEAADRLTMQQSALLHVTRLLHRVEVRGGTGSGKTVLALAQARELSRGSRERPAQRVALLCYSIGLATHLRRVTALWPHRQRPAFVGTFHDLGRSWGAPDGDRTDSDFWERRLPELMRDLAAELPDGQRFDAVLVDEAQDFAASWWLPLLAALRDEETGGLYLYSDENQRLFNRFGRPPVSLVPLVLDDNLRNTRQIAEAFDPLAPAHMRARGGDGVEARLVACSPGEEVETADDQLDALIDAGWQPRDVALLTTGSRHPVQLERSEQSQEHYWAGYWDEDDAFYGHVLGCKGLERRAVVLCVNSAADVQRGRERLYVGMSRATDELVVVADPDVLRELGGDEVMRRLVRDSR